jgi:hypothetical protein
VGEVLKEEGFAPLPRRLDEERPHAADPTSRPSPTSASSPRPAHLSRQPAAGCSSSSRI